MPSGRPATEVLHYEHIILDGQNLRREFEEPVPHQSVLGYRNSGIMRPAKGPNMTEQTCERCRWWQRPGWNAVGAFDDVEEQAARPAPRPDASVPSSEAAPEIDKEEFAALFTDIIDGGGARPLPLALVSTCRRHPPTAVLEISGSGGGGWNGISSDIHVAVGGVIGRAWPIVCSTDWCGEFDDAV